MGRKQGEVKAQHYGMTMGNNAQRAVLIFGGAGFIGCNLAHSLLEQTQASIHIFDNFSRPGVRANAHGLERAARGTGRLQITEADVRDRVQVEAAVRQANEIYHLAAQVAVTASVADPRHDFEVNLLGTFNVLEAARRAGHRPFLLFTSTNKVYGALRGREVIELPTRYGFAGEVGVTEEQPLDFHSPYGCSKGAADQYVRDYARIYGLPAVVLRMSCVAGPRQFGTEDQGWVAHLMYRAAQGLPIVIYGDGRQVRDVLNVRDLLRAFAAVRANLAATSGRIYNIGGGAGNTASLLELLKMIEARLGRSVSFAREAERPGDQRVYITDHARLTAATGWQPEAPVRETLAEIHQWWLGHNAAPAPPQAETIAAALPVPQTA